MVVQSLSHFPPRFLFLGAFTIASFFIITTIRWQSSTFSRLATPSDGCYPFPNAADVQIIVKTGANEIYEKLPTQLVSSLQCYTNPKLLIFSDLEQVIGSHRVHDVLANVTESVKNGSSFNYYHELQEMKKNRQEINTVTQSGRDGWDLDKFKFLHMLVKTWTLRPGLKWYVFIEADTYLFRSNLFLWLERYDSRKPLYFGSAAWMNDEAFSHGGSGFILSGAALAQYVAGDHEVAIKWDETMKKLQYGDQGLTRALLEKKVELTNKWPSIQGESPPTLPFGPGPGSNGEYWCQPLITMHHVTPDDVARVWEIEVQRPNQKKPFLPRELYETMAQGFAEARKSDWDNISDDIFYRAPGVKGDRGKKPEEMTQIEKEAYLSLENCAKACESETKCYQYLYSDKVCSFAWSFRIGRKRTGSTSGWPLERISKFQKSKTCWRPKWL